jgi:hypothetical protein
VTDAGDAARRAGFDRGFAGHSRRQAVAGLALTPAERLRWLEEAMIEMRRLLGRARKRRTKA